MLYDGILGCSELSICQYVSISMFHMYIDIWIFVYLYRCLILDLFAYRYLDVNMSIYFDVIVSF
jgi:hypothetical protein